MFSGTQEQFGNDIREVIERWRGKPLDDQITNGEAAGVLDFIRLQLMLEAMNIRFSSSAA